MCHLNIFILYKLHQNIRNFNIFINVVAFLISIIYKNIIAYEKLLLINRKATIIFHKNYVIFHKNLQPFF